MAEQDEKKLANEVASNKKDVEKSAKIAVRLLQGLGVGMVIYFTVPLLLLVLFDVAARRMFYMNIMCPDDIEFNIDRQNREIFIPHINAKSENIEVISQSDDSLSIRIQSEGVIEDEKVIDFKFEESVDNPVAADLNETKPITLKVFKASLECLPSNDYDEAAILILLSFVGGATGSIISILSRISQYNAEHYEDTELPFYIGLFKPIIGGTFGVFIFAILASGLIQISNPLSTGDNDLSSSINIEKWLFFIGISFVSGFSERLAQDIISITEDQLGGDSDSKDET